jgi:hypothetical protein
VEGYVYGRSFSQFITSTSGLKITLLCIFTQREERHLAALLIGKHKCTLNIFFPRVYFGSKPYFSPSDNDMGLFPVLFKNVHIQLRLCGVMGLFPDVIPLTSLPGRFQPTLFHSVLMGNIL